MSATALLEADCVSKHYGDRTVLNTASLRARAGMITALLGRNGAGKSTLLRCTVGEIDADQGNIRLDGATVVRPRWMIRCSSSSALRICVVRSRVRERGHARFRLPTGFPAVSLTIVHGGPRRPVAQRHRGHRAATE